jgi:hypothetical protein
VPRRRHRQDRRGVGVVPGAHRSAAYHLRSPPNRSFQ